MSSRGSGEPFGDASRLGLGGRLRAIFVTAPLIVGATVVLGTVSLVASFLDRTGRTQEVCAGLWVGFLLGVASVRVVTRGIENVLPGRGYVLCPNHQSQMDVPVLIRTFPGPLRFTAKKELFRVPFFGWHLGRAGHFPIDRENARAAVRSMRRATGVLGKGVSMVVFPEGRTSSDGRIHPFRRGAFLLAADSGAEILPVTILGTRRVLPPRSWLLASGTVEVTIHPAVSSNDEEPGRLATRTRDVIATRFADGPVRDAAGGGG